MFFFLHRKLLIKFSNLLIIINELLWNPKILVGYLANSTISFFFISISSMTNMMFNHIKEYYLKIKVDMKSNNSTHSYYSFNIHITLQFFIWIKKFFVFIYQVVE